MRLIQRGHILITALVCSDVVLLVAVIGVQKLSNEKTKQEEKDASISEGVILIFEEPACDIHHGDDCDSKDEESDDFVSVVIAEES